MGLKSKAKGALDGMTSVRDVLEYQRKDRNRAISGKHAMDTYPAEALTAAARHLGVSRAELTAGALGAWIGTKGQCSALNARAHEFVVCVCLWMFVCVFVCVCDGSPARASCALWVVGCVSRCVYCV